jgi:hypothetical protein
MRLQYKHNYKVLDKFKVTTNELINIQTVELKKRYKLFTKLKKEFDKNKFSKAWIQFAKKNNFDIEKYNRTKIIIELQEKKNFYFKEYELYKKLNNINISH